MKKVVITLIILVLALGLYYAMQGGTETASAELYKSEALGYSFEYRDGFVTQPFPGTGLENLREGVTLMSKEDYESIQRGERAGGEGPPTVNVLVFDNPRGLALDAWLRSYPQISNMSLLRGASSTAQVAQREAVIYETDGLYASRNAVFRDGSLIYLITGSYLDRDSDLYRAFDEVIETFQVSGAKSANLSIEVLPKEVRQGDPALVTIEGVSNAEIKSVTWQGVVMPVFIYEGKPRIILGIDLKGATGSYPVVINLADGTTLKKEFLVEKRVIASAPLGIPDKLGGNTPEAEQTLLATLAEENARIGSVKASSEQLWTEPFALPLKNAVVTDEYGYSRLTGDSTISHKGTDFRASVGTPVYAMNAGRVALVQEFRNYGKTVILDHGSGILTLYMHLSETSVSNGETVLRGEQIGKAGATGYAESPHLHLTVKINGTSIDPIKFMDLLSSS